MNSLLILSARILVITLCGAAGYFATAALTTKAPPEGDAGRSSTEASGALADKDAEITSELKPPAESELIAEWEQLRNPGGVPADLPTLYLQVKDLKDAFRRRAFRAALIAEWAATDPQAALAFLQEKDRGMIGQLAREWLRADPQAAVTGLLAGGEKTRGSLRGLLSDIARAAPTRLAEVVAVLPKSDSRWDTTTQDAFAIIAQENLETARSAALSLTGPMRIQALAGVARAWAEKNGPEALAWGQSLPPGEERDSVLKAALVGWAKTDPSAALDKIDLVPPGGDAMYHASDAGAQVLREAARQDWDKTMSWLRDHPGKLGAGSLEGLQSALCDRLAMDAPGTLRELDKSGSAGLQQVFGNAVLNQGYAQRDKIWEWLDSQPPTAFTRETRRALLNAIAWKEPDTAMEFLDRLPDTPEDQKLLQTGVVSLLNGGTQLGGLEQMLEAASPRLRPHLLLAGLQYGFSQSETIDPVQWAGRIDELPQDKRAEAAASLSRGWARLDPHAAVEWAQSLPDGPQRDSAVHSALNSWAAADPYEAAEWINTLETGPQRDQATMGLVNALNRSEPESAWTWAQSISTPARRQEALFHALRALHRKDPAIAQEMLQSSNLAPAEREALTQHLEQQRSRSESRPTAR